ncbi:hypothetical protein [Streptomyces sp. NPDC046988]|uniref:hypothetical protein n=1 Tax=Streptomyces sp. NPDC046988 TaxID=3154922 RepID=UPI0033D2A266
MSTDTDAEEVRPVPADTGAPAAETAVRERWWNGRRLARAAGGLLLAGALAGTTGYTVVSVNDADRDAGAPVWAPPKQMPRTDAATPTGLAGFLTPYRADGWKRGPDIEEYGSDITMSGARANALRKESLSGLPRSQRKELEKALDRRPVEEAAVRSYSRGAGEYPDTETGAVTATVALTRMADRSAARALSEGQSGLLEAFDVARGPRIKGHKDAKCFRVPAESEGGLDAMFCTAHRDDVLITVSADGGRPFATESVTALFTQQLNRIAETGEAV